MPPEGGVPGTAGDTRHSLTDEKAQEWIDSNERLAKSIDDLRETFEGASGESSEHRFEQGQKQPGRSGAAANAAAAAAERGGFSKTAKAIHNVMDVAKALGAGAELLGELAAAGS